MLKRGFEFSKIIVWAGKGESFEVLSERIDMKNLLCDFSYGLLGLLLGQVPRTSSQAIQFGVSFICANIFLQDADAVCRDIESIIVCILNEDKIIGLLFYLHFTETSITAYTVILVDNQIPHIDLAKGGQAESSLSHSNRCLGASPF